MAKDAIEEFKTKGHSTIKQTKTDKTDNAERNDSSRAAAA